VLERNLESGKRFGGDQLEFRMGDYACQLGDKLQKQASEKGQAPSHTAEALPHYLFSGLRLAAEPPTL
jgi:hypothetical protein